MGVATYIKTKTWKDDVLANNTAIRINETAIVTLNKN